HVFEEAFNGLDHLTCYSVKSNSNIAILRIFALLGGGADIVSGGELFRALKAGISPEKIVFSGVGKTSKDMEEALRSNILMLNVESYQELQALNTIAKGTGRRATIAIRINPDVKPDTHRYITTGSKENKFGIPIKESLRVYESACKLEHIDIKGISCHVGSQLTDIAPFVEALKKLKELLSELNNIGIHIKFLNLGGGLGITYNDEKPPHPSQYAQALKEVIENDNVTLILEPGRVIIGNAGILVTRVIYTKSISDKNFIIVDAGMNDLIRPALYDSFHSIQPVKMSDSKMITADLVGPVCETGDFFARDRKMPSFKPGDLVAIMSSGAYGFSMASNYNSRPRPPEVLVKENGFSVIRPRETYDDLIDGEKIPEFLE
ncbi:MAG TPA: diaminopimelate decarboxylase, partial [Desulfatiglandales bacterium]|nr:diaminopimelate decarboxylase [Desulfatiglandales bacterium]